MCDIQNSKILTTQIPPPQKKNTISRILTSRDKERTKFARISDKRNYRDKIVNIFVMLKRERERERKAKRKKKLQK